MWESRWQSLQETRARLPCSGPNSCSEKPMWTLELTEPQSWSEPAPLTTWAHKEVQVHCHVTAKLEMPADRAQLIYFKWASVWRESRAVLQTSGTCSAHRCSTDRQAREEERTTTSKKDPVSAVWPECGPRASRPPNLPPAPCHVTIHCPTRSREGMGATKKDMQPAPGPWCPGGLRTLAERRPNWEKHCCSHRPCPRVGAGRGATRGPATSPRGAK